MIITYLNKSRKTILLVQLSGDNSNHIINNRNILRNYHRNGWVWHCIF